jgi:hypothetical protein
MTLILYIAGGILLAALTLLIIVFLWPAIWRLTLAATLLAAAVFLCFMIQAAFAEPTITILTTKPAPQATTGTASPGAIERAMPGARLSEPPPPPRGPWVVSAPQPRGDFESRLFGSAVAGPPPPVVGPSLMQWSIRKRCWPDCLPYD